MNTYQLRRWQPRRRRLPLRLRLALWSAGLVVILSFALVLFVNTAALDRFHRVIAATTVSKVNTTQFKQDACPDIIPLVCQFAKSGNSLERALLLELRNISLIGLGLVAIIGGLGAYWLAGMALRPVQQVSEAAQRISANTLNTRLSLDGPNDEIKELADTFDAMLARLERTFELQNRFVADVAHELRTPLASLRTNLEVVSADADATLDDYRTMAATQERALTRLERLVADLLILATSEQPLSSNEVALGPLLEEVFHDLQQMAGERQVKLLLASRAEVVVAGNEPLLARVFSNLIENGIYYNHLNGEVIVDIDCKDSNAVVTVSDTGIGISLEQQAHIFDRFYRVDSSRSRHREGAGLGLSIVSAIIHQHGGQVQVENIAGKGSTFIVLLPLYASGTPSASPAECLSPAYRPS